MRSFPSFTSMCKKALDNICCSFVTRDRTLINKYCNFKFQGSHNWHNHIQSNNITFFTQLPQTLITLFSYTFLKQIIEFDSLTIFKATCSRIYDYKSKNGAHLRTSFETPSDAASSALTLNILAALHYDSDVFDAHSLATIGNVFLLMMRRALLIISNSKTTTTNKFKQHVQTPKILQTRNHPII